MWVGEWWGVLNEMKDIHRFHIQRVWHYLTPSLSFFFSRGHEEGGHIQRGSSSTTPPTREEGVGDIILCVSFVSVSYFFFYFFLFVQVDKKWRGERMRQNESS